MTLALFLLYLLCVALSGHPSLIVSQLATLAGLSCGLLFLARFFSELEVPA